MPPASQRIAVVDLGTNSTRLLIADVQGNGGGTAVTEILKRSTVTRLGQGVDASGRLADEAVKRVFDVLAGYRELIDEHEAGGTIVALATSAVRDSANGGEFREQLQRRFGFEAHTISGDREAQLTFLGATSARDEGEEPVLVIDIGGGSTEFVVGRPGEKPGFHVSTQSGAVRQTERHLHDDPPPREQLDELKQEVRGIIESDVPAEVRDSVTRGIAVAGTATQLAAIDQRLDPYDSERVHGYRLTREGCENMLERLASVALDERRATPGLDPARAPTIVAGAAILVTAMHVFGLEGVETSENDILHGAALIAAREG